MTTRPKRKPKPEKWGSTDVRRNPLIVFRKLGQEQADAQAQEPLDIPEHPHDKGLIEIDPRLKGVDRLDRLIHESIHLALWYLPEEEVARAGRFASRVLNLTGYMADEDWQEENFTGQRIRPLSIQVHGIPKGLTKKSKTK